MTEQQRLFEELGKSLGTDVVPQERGYLRQTQRRVRGISLLYCPMTAVYLTDSR